MNKCIIGIGLVAIVLVGRVHAQEPLALSYKEAVRIALDNNIPLKQERNNLTGIQAGKTASIASLAPDLSAFGAAYRNDGNFFIEQEARVVNTVSENVFASIDANLILFNGFSKLSAVKREESRLDAQLNTITRAEQNVINSITIQYLIILQDQEVVKIEQKNLEEQHVLLDQITTMFEVGSRAITDKYQQEFVVQNAELVVIRAKNQLINDKATLAQTMMIDPTSNFVLEEPGWRVEDITIDQYDPQDIYNTAISTRPDLVGSQELGEAARRNVTAQKGSYVPTISGFFSVSSRWTDATVTRDFQEQFIFDNKRQQYGLRLNIPLFSGLRNRANVVNAKVLRENAFLDAENQELLVKTEVMRAYQNFGDVVKAYQVTLIQYQAAEKNLETQQESYNLGVTGLIELSRAQVGSVEAQTSLASARYALLFQEILMDFAIGTLRYDQIPE